MRFLPALHTYVSVCSCLCVRVCKQAPVFPGKRVISVFCPHICTRVCPHPHPPERAVPVAAEVPDAEVVGHDDDEVGPRGVAGTTHAHAEQEEEREGLEQRHRPRGRASVQACGCVNLHTRVREMPVEHARHACLCHVCKERSHVTCVPSCVFTSFLLTSHAPVSLSHSGLRSRWAPHLGLRRSPTIPPSPPAPGTPPPPAGYVRVRRRRLSVRSRGRRGRGSGARAGVRALIDRLLGAPRDRPLPPEP